MDNNDDTLKSKSKEQIIRTAEPIVTIEKVTTTTKKAFERKTANEILIFVQNLDDFDEADTFIMLYIKALNNTLESNKENYRIDENEVRKIIAETDDRFVYGEEVCEEYEEE
jgi:ribosomal protein L17